MAEEPKSTDTESTEDVFTFKIDKEQVRRSVSALWQYVQKSQGLSSATLLDFAEQVNMQLGFIKVPILPGNKTVKIRLKHTLLQENQDVCLFVKDLNPRNRDYSKTVDYFKELLEKHDINSVTQIIPVKSLKTEYKAFESKRNLSDMYEFFLTDERIAAMLPRHLGKHFLSKKRQPVTVKLNAKKLKKEIDRALATSLCTITGRGATCQVKVAHTGMTEDQAMENVVKAAETLAASIPGGPINVKTLHIRTFDSPAIPFYVSNVNPNKVETPIVKEPRVQNEPEEITTVEGAKVLVTSDGYVDIVTGSKRPKKWVRNRSVRQPPAKAAEKDNKTADNKPAQNKGKESRGKPFGRTNKRSRQSNNRFAKKSQGQPPAKAAEKDNKTADNKPAQNKPAQNKGKESLGKPFGRTNKRSRQSNNRYAKKSQGQPPAKAAEKGNKTADNKNTVTQRDRKNKPAQNEGKESLGNPFGRTNKKSRQSNNRDAKKSQGGQKRKANSQGKPPKFQKMQ